MIIIIKTNQLSRGCWKPTACSFLEMKWDISWSLALVIVAGIIRGDVAFPKFLGARTEAYAVILVPGLEGSRIEAKLVDPIVESACKRNTSDYFTLWVNLDILFRGGIKCFVSYTSMDYNATTGTSANVQGVLTRIPGFGDTRTIETLDDAGLVPYMAVLVHSLTAADVGLKRNISLRGAPYDFRKAPNEQSEYFDNLKSLIEDTYRHRNKPVHLVAHSMGAPMMLHFLNQQSQGWKDKFIKSLVTLSGVWGGAVKALDAIFQGYTLGIPFVRNSEMRKLERSISSLSWLMPSPKLWGQHDTLIEVHNKDGSSSKYTTKDYKKLFQLVEYPHGYQMWGRIQNLTYDLSPPGVEVHCLVGVGVPALSGLSYQPDMFPDNPMVLYGDGDGTVNRRSLDVCKKWKTQQTQEVHYVKFRGVSHVLMVSDAKVIKYIKHLVTKN